MTIVHDVAIQNLPVRFAIDRAMAMTATHVGVYDVAYLSCPLNMAIMCPSDEAELLHMTATAAAYDDGPSALGIRVARVSVSIFPKRGLCCRLARGG